MEILKLKLTLSSNQKISVEKIYTTEINRRWTYVKRFGGVTKSEKPRSTTIVTKTLTATIIYSYNNVSKDK